MQVLTLVFTLLGTLSAAKPLQHPHGGHGHSHGHPGPSAGLSSLLSPLLPSTSWSGIPCPTSISPSTPTSSGSVPTGASNTSQCTTNSTSPGPLNLPVNSSWWYPHVDRTSSASRDYVPYLNNSNSYQVYVAVPSGDNCAFINALYAGGPSGDRDNMWLAGQPRTIYLAPGTYVLDSTVYIDTDTVIIGDALNPPVIKAASGFLGNYLIVGGEGDASAEGGELHFSVLIKNVILDTTLNQNVSDFTALSWRVAQNSGLLNVAIRMPSSVHTGMYVGQGSTIQIGDISFHGGKIGLHYEGSEQAALKNLHFSDCSTGILVDSGFAINILAPLFERVNLPVVYNSGEPWISVVDGISKRSGDFFTSNVQYPNFMIENIQKDTANSAMVSVYNKTIIGGISKIATYVYGNTYGASPIYQTNGTAQNISRPAALAPNGRYPVVTAPQYPNATIHDVINLKDRAQNGGQTLHGDGVSDDTAALQVALTTAAAQGKIAYLPYGIYRVQNTITIPCNTRLVGNGWSTISGYGPAFSNEFNPTPVVQVGNAGETGIAQIQDMRFTVGEQLPGAIILQFNMAGSQPGDVSIHNSLITVGGTRDTEIDCSSESQCKAAYIGLHLAKTSSTYVDNFWSWVADHASDNSTSGTRSAAKGGVLVEATAGTWFNGLGSEHWWLYTLNLQKASSVFISLLQTETNYFQGAVTNATLPGPFTPTAEDPDFSWCAPRNSSWNTTSEAWCHMAPAQYIDGGCDIYSYASGDWWFTGLETGNDGSQEFMNVMVSKPEDSYWFGLTAHGAQELMRLPNGTQFGDTQNYGGSWGSLCAEFATGRC
jgi:hypothetical protein